MTSQSDAVSIASVLSPTTVSGQQRLKPLRHNNTMSILERPAGQQNLHIDFDEFYTERVSNFENERSVFANYFRLIEPKRDTTYNLEWENRKLHEETRLSQLETAEIENKLNKLRTEIAGYQREIAEEQNAQFVRRQQIVKLEELARPVEHDITYIVPDRLPQNREPKFANVLQDTSPSSPRKPRETKQIWKTVKTGELIQLEGRLRDETLRVSAYLQDVHAAVKNAAENRYLRTATYTEGHSKDIEVAKELWKENDTVDFRSFYAVVELLKLRYRIMLAQREEVEELEHLQRERDEFFEKEKAMRAEVLEEINRTKVRTKQDVEDSTRAFQRQLAELKTQQDTLHNQQNELRERTSLVTSREEQLYQFLLIVKERYKRLRQRHALDLEGFDCEVEMLDKKIHALNRKMEKISAAEKVEAELLFQRQQLIKVTARSRSRSTSTGRRRRGDAVGKATGDKKKKKSKTKYTV